jgi:muramoyltetrapeptide carboxypeptidase LdcA involved in peptidoglycan recycling
MSQQEPIDLTQSEQNSLSAIAEQERKKLFPRNDYNTNNLYSSTNPDALATGDEQGKGTGGDLDVYNTSAGAIQDILERKSEIVINKFNASKTYPDF